jgi:phosphoribosylaminoimidazole-succinocarboxamide synthase
MPAALTASAIRAALPATAQRHIDGLPWPKIASGKVRDIFAAGDALLMVASDRLSAFDVILPDGIPGKGIILTQLSLHWFAATAHLLPNHLVADHDRALRALLADHPDLVPRCMLVRKLQPLPIEAVVRGYLAGSAWQDYRQTGNLYGQPLPAGLREGERLPEPMFTPTSKAAPGSHDLPLDPQDGAARLGAERFAQVRAAALSLYAFGAATAARAGLILADTKFEFGTDATGALLLIDEVCTPDSSRYWPAAQYAPGRPQTAFDKQYVRDYLETLAWDKTAPGPRIPEDVILRTRERYLAAAEMLLG